MLADEWVQYSLLVFLHVRVFIYLFVVDLLGIGEEKWDHKHP